jgi:hypothetical protein
VVVQRYLDSIRSTSLVSDCKNIFSLCFLKSLEEDLIMALKNKVMDNFQSEPYVGLQRTPLAKDLTSKLSMQSISPYLISNINP